MTRPKLLNCMRQILFACVLWALLGLTGQAFPGNHVLVVPLQGIIGPATADYVIKSLETANHDGAELVIIQLDTPGGLDPSMRAIIQAILSSHIPVATFVSPAGARAASAGTFILYASHIAAMTPASNLGAASPVAIGIGGTGNPAPDSNKDTPAKPETDKSTDPDVVAPSPDSGNAMERKIKNDAAAYIRSLAQLRGRDIKFAEQAVLDASSLSAHEALEQGVIDYVADDLQSLLKQLDGTEVRITGDVTVQLHTAQASVEILTPGWRTRILSLLTNPQLALVLMMIGIYGLFFELTSPGFALPGVAGVICLLLALYSFHMLPVNWAGVALVFVGALMMIGEVFLPSFGVLGIGGIVAFILGGLFLTDTGIPGFDVSLSFLVGLAMASAVLLLMAGALITRAYKHHIMTGNEAMLGLEGRVTQVGDDAMYAQIRGEQWRINSSQILAVGDRVRVESIRGLTLDVIRSQDTVQH